ncbi:MAG TPA: hypothetical protein O0W90_03075 [Methanocorpusculum sp.]|nr:hypothetical protein [Methanocorpusculum sp.]
MTMNEIKVKDEMLICTDGRKINIEKCRFCIHSRYFIINGRAEKSPSLAYCNIQRVTKEADFRKADAVGCAEMRGDGFSSIGNIIS